MEAVSRSGVTYQWLSGEQIAGQQCREGGAETQGVNL
jgi:hypothetical protein